MRKIRTISFVLVFCMILVVSASANLNDSIVTYYSREQFVLRLAAMESIDMQAAEARVFELENSTGQNGQYTYCEFTSFYDYCNGHVVEAGVLFLMGNGSAHRSSCGVASKWTKAATTGNYTWTEAYHVVEFTPTQIVQMVRGRVAISLNINSPRVARLKTQLHRVGFPQGVVNGNVWHSAKVSSWTDTLKFDSSSPKLTWR